MCRALLSGRGYVVSNGFSRKFRSSTWFWTGESGIELLSSTLSTEAVIAAFVCFPATSLSSVYVYGSVGVIVVIVSLYPISIFPIRAFALKSLSNLSRAISKCKSPMPAK